jgi:hypothetical protein
MSRLIYINGMGPNFRGDNIYEFIFSDTLEVFGENWESKPANGYPLPPDIEYIKKVGTLVNEEIVFELVQDSDVFSVIDSMDNVIALGWEKETNEIDFSLTKRLVFHFGDTEEDVKNKLYERDIVLQFEKEVVYEK